MFIHKPTGAELLWQADPAVWKRHAPILFPYTGKLTGGKMLAKGVEYAGGQHGFARDVEHTMTHHADNLLEFELHANAETLPKWPYAFVLRSTFTLEGETVHHTLTVENPVEDKLCFGIGYHPAFALPFDDRHVTEDYEIRFDGVESPLCVSAQPNGLLNGQSYYLARNVEAIQLTDDLFDNDSHAMVNLRSGACFGHREGHGPQRHLRCLRLPVHPDLVRAPRSRCTLSALSRGTACPARKTAPSTGSSAPAPRSLKKRRELVHHAVHDLCPLKVR